MAYSLPPDAKPGPLNAVNVPPALRPFIPLAEKFGIGDDGYRDELLFRLDINELEELIQAFDEIPQHVLDAWLVGEEANSLAPTHEYVTFTCLTMSYYMAKVRLKTALSRMHSE